MITETTSSPNDPSLLDRAFGEDGVVLLLRVAVAAMATFIAGAVVQRVLVADFAFKAGSIEIPVRQIKEVAATSREGLQELAAQVGDQDKLLDKTADEAMALIQQLVATLERLEEG